MRTNKLYRGIALIAASGALLALGANEAVAGTNGQHIRLSASRQAGSTISYATITGLNENGDLKTQKDIFLPATRDGKGKTGASYWWWKADHGQNVKIDWSDDQNAYVKTTYCDVPVDQGSNDWFGCSA